MRLFLKFGERRKGFSRIIPERWHIPSSLGRLFFVQLNGRSIRWLLLVVCAGRPFQSSRINTIDTFAADRKLLKYSPTLRKLIQFLVFQNSVIGWKISLCSYRSRNHWDALFSLLFDSIQHNRVSSGQMSNFFLPKVRCWCMVHIVNPRKMAVKHLPLKFGGMREWN